MALPSDDTPLEAAAQQEERDEMRGKEYESASEQDGGVVGLSAG